MRKALLLTITILFSVASFAGIKKTQYGEKITLKEETSIKELNKNPKKYDGKIVKIKGKIKKVCPMAGCWIDVVDEKTGEEMHVKVDDGVIAFPEDSAGKIAVAQGKIQAIKMDKKAATRYFKHRADELGKKFDPKSVTGPMTIYQIKGDGAEIIEN